MAEQANERRRTYMVLPRFQIRYVALYLLQTTAILAFLGSVVHTHVARTAEVAAHVPSIDMFSRLAIQNQLIDNVHGFYARSLILIATTCVIMCGFGLLGSHRLAGPVIKLQRHLTSVAEGHYSQRIAFRSTDQLDEFAQKLNQTVESLEKRRLQAKELAIDLARRGRGLEDSQNKERVLNDMEGMVSTLKGLI